MGLFDFLFKKDEYQQGDILQEKYEYLLDKAYNATIKDDDISQLDENEKVLYVLFTFNLEVQNGGLCQFFVNSSREYAPLVSGYLEVVGALEHKELYDNFVIDNKLDLTDLSSFEITDLSEFKEKNNEYPFDEFDDLFYDLKNLEDYLYTFIKKKKI